MARFRRTRPGIVNLISIETDLRNFRPRSRSRMRNPNKTRTTEVPEVAPAAAAAT
jgi:hypothetical protein